ncbi:MAG: hypothetical protein EXR93_01400 [Gemmatimonadetes bacterium]|nr:hypothetical protein [Gemmatimonadota bacterium]
MAAASLATPLLGQDPSKPGPFPEYLSGRTRNRPPGQQGSPNIRVLSHIPGGGYIRLTNLDIEQEMSRPYIYVGVRWKPSGFDIISVEDPARARTIYSWRIENSELHEGWGPDDVKYFKLKGRYYVAAGVAYSQRGTDADLGAVIFDVTGLPDTATIREVGRLRVPDAPGGFHNSFIYKHSNGSVLFFACVANKPYADIYDMEKFLAGVPENGRVGRVPLPEPRGTSGGYHDIYVGFDQERQRDLFWGNGPEVTMAGGNYVYDVTEPANPKLVASVVGFAGQTGTHTFIPSPDSRYAVVRTNGDHQPIRIFDMQPAWDGKQVNISRSIGAWTPDWHNTLHNIEVRWPYAFLSSYEDGLQIFNFMDPANPYTVGFFDSYDGPHESRGPGTSHNGAWGIDIRNADGLIVLSDGTTGFWAFRMDGFDGWTGRQWGVPNTTSAQDWDNGPEGLRRRK